jgi:hypothetical protein
MDVWVDELAPVGGGTCTLSGRRRRGTGGGDGWLTDIDRPKRAEEGKEATVESAVYSA